MARRKRKKRVGVRSTLLLLILALTLVALGIWGLMRVAGNQPGLPWQQQSGDTTANAPQGHEEIAPHERRQLQEILERKK